MTVLLHILRTARLRLLSGGRAATAYLGLILLVCIAGLAQAGPIHELVAGFDLLPRHPGSASLVLGPDSCYWGTTTNGGAYGYGCIYKVNTSTGAVTTVVSFTGYVGDKIGVSPQGSLVSDGAGFLWGTTNEAGARSFGTVYKVNASTGALTTVVEFGNNNGAHPRAGLVSDGAGFLWGTTGYGGANNFGTIFKVNASTGALTTVGEFTNNGDRNRGAIPMGGLASDGVGFFWGASCGGGANNCGTIYKVNASTGELTTMVDFTDNGASNKGSSPYAELVSDGAGSFWGTTRSGGASGYGTVFKVNASTGELTTMVEFTNDGASNRGAYPEVGLVSDGAGFFWGTTPSGGSNYHGTVYKVNASTGALTTLVDFTANYSRGFVPPAGLLSDGVGFLWGTTPNGGANDCGTVFKVNASTGALTTVVEFGNNKGVAPLVGLVSDGADFLWGTTQSGGANDCGTVFKVNASTSELTTVVDFTGNGASDRGAFPCAGLVSDGAGYFWGTTSGINEDVTSNYGTVFKVNASTGELTTVVEFTNKGANNRGSHPCAGLMSDGGGFFWGTTEYGGANGWGTVFKVNASTGELTTVVEFSYSGASNSGARPFAGLVSDGAGFLWGTTSAGGASGDGTVFKVSASTGELTTLVEFTSNGASNRGARPYAGLVSDGAGYLWGTTSAGGVNGWGTIYKMNASTGVLTTVVEFTKNGASNRGAYPRAGLVSDGAGFFWGTTSEGGAGDCGTVFKVNARTGALETLLEFTGDGSQANSGANPGYGALIKHSDGNFYGTTEKGGPGKGGTIFRLRFGPTPVTQPADGITLTGATLKGMVTSNNDGATAFSFQYGTSPDLNGAATVNSGTLENGASAYPVSATLTGLSVHTTYYYRVVASNAGNSALQEGGIASFTTSNTAPIALDASASATSGDAQTITLPFPATDADGDAVMIESVTPAAGLMVNSFSDSNVTFTPVYGFTGTSSLSYTVADGFGGTATGTITVTIGRGELATEQLFAKGAAVPGAGVPGSRIPAEATWDSFGVPAINGAGELAFAATLKLSPSGTLTGIFAGPADAPALLVKKGDAAPGANGAVFASFKDPLFNEAGRVAFVANISGAGVTAANNSGIWTNALGADAIVFQLVARKGGSVPGVDWARWKSFSSLALASGELNLFGTMASGSGGVNPASDLVLCRYGTSVPSGELLLREGQQLSIAGTTGKLKSFAALATVSGSSGQRRQPLEGGLHVKATLSDRRTFLLNNIGAAGLNQLEAVTGDSVVDQNSQPAGTLASLGFAADASGSAWGSVFKAALKGAGTSASDNAALVGASANGLSILARKGEEADAVRAPGALIKEFASEPVASEAGYAAVVTLSGDGVSKPRDTALLWRGNGFSGIVAREGDPASGADGALYGSFVSVALPDGAAGPIFVAKLLSAKTGPAVRVTARNDIGLWVMDTTGTVRLLLREGDPLDGKTVSSFVVLPVVLGSAAQARSYNDAGKIAVKVTFSDRTQAIIRIRVP